MTLTLGYTPKDLTVIVSRGGDFFATLRRGDGTAWDTDLLLTLDFGAVEWTATVDGPVAAWHASATEVATMLASNPNTVRLWHIKGDRRLLWAAGRVSAR